MIADNRELIVRFLTLAYCNQAAAAVALLHSEVTWTIMGDPTRLTIAGAKDRAQTERLLYGFKKVVPKGMEFVIHGLIAEDDKVAAEVEAHGVWYDGRAYHNQYHFCFEIRDRLIFAIREYMDTLLVRELTASPAQ